MVFENPFRRQRASAEPASTTPDAPSVKDVRSAYDRGRRDALRSRKRHPAAMTLLFVAAAVGVAVLGYAAYSGSFGVGGERLDQDLAIAADRAEPMVRDAARGAGQALTDATRSSNDEPPAPPERR
jgi:hypothetical protein